MFSHAYISCGRRSSRTEPSLQEASGLKSFCQRGEQECEDQGHFWYSSSQEDFIITKDHSSPVCQSPFSHLGICMASALPASMTEQWMWGESLKTYPLLLSLQSGSDGEDFMSLGTGGLTVQIFQVLFRGGQTCSLSLGGTPEWVTGCQRSWQLYPVHTPLPFRNSYICRFYKIQLCNDFF